MIFLRTRTSPAGSNINKHVVSTLRLPNTASKMKKKTARSVYQTVQEHQMLVDSIVSSSNVDGGSATARPICPVSGRTLLARRPPLRPVAPIVCLKALASVQILTFFWCPREKKKGKKEKRGSPPLLFHWTLDDEEIFGRRLTCFHGSVPPLYKPSGSIFSNPSKSHMALVGYNGEKS